MASRGQRKPASADRARRGRERRGREEEDSRATALADLHGVYCLDVLVDIAQAVSRDAVRNPLRYRDAESPASFHAASVELGTRVDWLTPTQRAELYLPVFSEHPLGGRTAAPTPFDVAASAIRQAAGAITSAVYPQALDALFLVLETTVQNFKTSVLQPWRAAILEAVTAGAVANLQRACTILRDPGIATAFAVEHIADGAWPATIDAGGSELVAAISQTLGAAGGRQLSGADFTNLQRASESGGRVISLIGQHPDGPPDQPVSEDQALGELLREAVAWQQSLAQLGGVSGPAT